MLSTIDVKNFALIDEANVNLESGFNILTGETGAGKSILIDAVNAALGGKVSRDCIGKHGDYALIELVFVVEDPDRIELLRKEEVYPEEDGCARVVFDSPQRAITPGQMVVLYQDAMVVGSGTITQTF